jgi:hypothetical protein
MDNNREEQRPEQAAAAASSSSAPTPTPATAAFIAAIGGALSMAYIGGYCCIRCWALTLCCYSYHPRHFFKPLPILHMQN